MVPFETGCPRRCRLGTGCPKDQTVPGREEQTADYSSSLCGEKVLVPLLRTVEEAKLVAAAARFPPHGRRGFGTTLPLERFTPAPSMAEYVTESHESLLTMVQIETKEALEQVEEIAAVDGVDVLFVGPFDLGKSLSVLALLENQIDAMVLFSTS